MGNLWNRSGTIERYGDDLRADGAQAFFFQGGTTSPLTVFADSGESDAFPTPVTADANGRWPDIFVPYILNYDVQVKSKYGEQLSFSQRIPNPNPVEQTIIVPPERQVQTGMIHPEFVNAPKAGYVRLNGKTIGNGLTSGPNSERANSDTIDLYRYLWNNITTDTLAPVLPGGRGASADADFAANKTLTLPDMRGALFSGLDDMGNSPAGNFGTLSFTAGNSIIVASLLGANSVTLVVENMPAHVHTGSTTNHLGHVHNVNGTTAAQSVNHTHSVTVSGATGNSGALDHSHTYVDNYTTPGLGAAGGGSAVAATQTLTTTSSLSSGFSLDHIHSVSASGTTSTENASHTHSFSAQTTAIPPGPSGGEGFHNHTFTTDSKGGEIIPPATVATTRAFNNMPVTRLVTWFIKL